MRAGRPEQSPETPPQAQRGHEPFGEALGLVSADAEPPALGLQMVEQGLDPRINRRIHGVARSVMLEITRIERRDLVFGQLDPGLFMAHLNQRAPAPPRSRAALRDGDGRQLQRLQQVVERADEVGRRVHQSAVEIEDHRAGKLLSHLTSLLTD